MAGSSIVLCDDLTGSSVQSIMLKDRGLRVRQIISLPYAPLPLPGDGEALVINCDSRRRPPSEAADIFRRVISLCHPEAGLAKRIDTTLRGHLLLETKEMLQARPGAAAMVVPAFPSSGRVTVGGYQLLNGHLLERTEVARDPIWPISSSFVPGYFRSGFLSAHIPIDTVQKGMKETASSISALLAGGTRIITADAQNEGDVEVLAAAAASLPSEIFPVDPGPFTAAFLSARLFRRRSRTILAVIGSSCGRTRDQLAYLRDKLSQAEFSLSPLEPLEEARTRLRLFLSKGEASGKDFVLIRPDSSVVKGCEDSTARNLAELGKEALRILGKEVWGALLSGGDTAAAFFSLSGASSLRPEIEIQPLIMGGIVGDGPFAGLRIVTKGGLIGEEDGIYKAVLWLRREQLTCRKT